MDISGSDLLPVIADDGSFVRIVTTVDLVRLDEILRTTDEGEP